MVHSLLLAMCNHTSCLQVYELPQSYSSDDREVTLWSKLHVYNVHLASVQFEHSVCRESLITTYIMHIVSLLKCALMGLTTMALWQILQLNT